ncbi:MAG TPA: tRNA pseudouridine(55) synthase TruB [Firmicutes bacterium]|jgi:tRNA pseudouridine55 synthase|nr:tRNA pseudouridine(55) synthase TruB [Bacillota bacterium]
MNGIIVIDKPKDYTSRDIVNIVSKKLNTKKVGHTGTLDPLATGVLVLPIGRALKVSELLTSNTKEYIAEVILGYETDMLDITGTEIKRNIPSVTKEELLKVLKSYIGKYNQEVPLYSAVKVGGRKLYEYARSGTPVIPPSKEVEVYSLELISDLKHINGAVEFTIRCEVSKGTYIRSLIRDIAYSLNTYGTMKNLIRTRQGIFTLKDAYTLKDIEENNYKLLSIKECLPNIKTTVIEEPLLTKVKNGMVLDKFFKENMSLLLDKEGKEIAIYIASGDNKVKPYKMIEV